MKRRVTSELGTKEVHQRHSVMVEGGAIPRARVMDQGMIDRYLMAGLINLAQHQAGEHLLELASKANLWAKAPDPDRVRSDTKKSTVPSGIFSFGHTLDLVRRRYGDMHAYIVEEVVCHDWDISENSERMDALRESLQLICDRRMSGGRNPVRHLK